MGWFVLEQRYILIFSLVKPRDCFLNYNQQKKGTLIFNTQWKKPLDRSTETSQAKSQDPGFQNHKTSQAMS